MKEIFISIIIPTKERSFTLSHSIKSVLIQNYSNFELIISDNFSSDDSKKIVHEFNDSRIKYINTGARVSMSDNWEFALNNCNGEWVTVIGDDDALLPDALKKVNTLIDQYSDIDVIRSETCYYFYPKVNNQLYGLLGIPLAPNKNYEIRNCDEWLDKVLFSGYNYTELPMLYNGGFVSKKIIDRAKSFNKLFINSSSPDVYSSMIFCHLIKKYLFSFEPFAINGASLKSNGVNNFSKSNNDTNYIGKQFREENNFCFNNKIPLYSDGRYPQSIKAYVYDSYFYCVELLGIPSKISPQSQIETILAYDFKNDQFFKEWILEYSKLYSVNLFYAQLNSFFKKFFFDFKKFKHFGKYVEIGDKFFPIEDVFVATKFYRPILLVSYSLKTIIKLLIRKIIS
jgi:glycosyltransferase involved in cell wall biosynthesis